MPASEGIRRFWRGGQGGISGGRVSRTGFYYYAYDGKRIARSEWTFSSELSQEIATAEVALRLLNDDPPRSQVLEALARQLLRSEAVASSRIEGLELSHQRVAEAAFDPAAAAENARVVVGNVRAMEEAIRLASGRRLSVEGIEGIHRRLFEGTREARTAGRIRTTQNWIGHRDDPYRARFVPVPEDQVRPLLEDLCAFVQRDDIPPVAQAAIAHAQFETIHPFGDGNGRVGRALIHLVVRRRRVCPHYVPPISIVLAANYNAYEAGLTAFRSGAIDEWCVVFARATTVACERARDLVTAIEKLKAEWREQAGRPRAGSAADKLIDVLPVHPVLDLRSAERELRVSDEAARLAIARLADAGVLREITKRRRGRAWECVGLFRVLDAFDRRLATPAGALKPGRAAPRDTQRGPAAR